MGYTHYWEFKRIGNAKDNEAKYLAAIKDCQTIIRRFYKERGGLSGYSAHTTLGAYGGINVNGKGEEGHETFALREHFGQNIDGSMGFCKTAEKPYDLVVVACLAVLKHRLGDAIEVKSNGKAIDWSWGVNYARKVTRLKIANPIPLVKNKNVA